MATVRSHAPLRQAERLADAASTAAVYALKNFGRSDVASHALATKNFPDEKSAGAAFEAQKARLGDVNGWNDLSGWENAKFGLVGADGQPARARSAQVGDFIRIKLPGSPSHDWVQIEKIENTADRFSLTVRPSHDPTKRPLEPNVTAHFFTREATNTFSVEKQGTEVRTRVLGLHERANVGDAAGGLVNAARNRATAEGAWGVQRPIPGTTTTVNGMQQHQWNVFTSRLSAVK